MSAIDPSSHQPVSGQLPANISKQAQLQLALMDVLPDQAAISVEAAALFLGVSRNTVRNMFEDGRLSYRRIGSLRNVLVGSLRALSTNGPEKKPLVVTGKKPPVPD